MSRNEKEVFTSAPVVSKKHKLQKLAIKRTRTAIINKIDNQLDSSLIYAVQVGDLDKVKQFIHEGADINKKLQNSSTLLHVAAKYGHHKVTKVLIENGADVGFTLTDHRERGFTPLYLSVLKNHLKCAKLLLESGASIYPKVEDLCHPIHIAVFKGHTKMAAMLLDSGADAVMTKIV